MRSPCFRRPLRSRPPHPCTSIRNVWLKLVHSLSTILFITLLLIAFVSCARIKLDPVTSQELEAHVTYLASDELAGRLIGSTGITLAEEYIAAHFDASGLEKLPDEEDYYLDFSLHHIEHGSGLSDLRILEGDTVYAFLPGVDFKLFTFSQALEFDGPVVFAGYGITAPVFSYDDYEKLDVAGKAVLVIRYEPDADQWPEGGKHTKHATFVEKARNAHEHGAVAMLLFDTPRESGSGSDMSLYKTYSFAGETLNAYAGNSGTPKMSIPALWVSAEVASRLFRLEESELSTLGDRLNRGETPAEIARADNTHNLNARLTALRAPSRSERVYETPEIMPVRNVASYVSGSSNQWIIIGAHHDHIGSRTGTGDTIYNGADDNASGASLVLELAEYFSSTGRAPYWNLLFVTFTAEEQGLYGSQHLAGRLPASTIALMINFDMIGRNPDKPVIVFGDGFIDGMSDLLSEIAADSPVNLQLMGRETQYNSDHRPFFDQNLPTLWFHTDVHPDYHQVSDHTELLDYSRMAGLGEIIIRLIDILEERKLSPERI